MRVEASRSREEGGRGLTAAGVAGVFVGGVGDGVGEEVIGELGSRMNMNAVEIGRVVAV